MKTSISTKGLAGADTPLLAVIVAQGGTAGAGGAPLKDASLERAFAAGDYKGKKDETLLVYGAGKAERVLLIGVGKGSEITRTSIRRAAAIAASGRRPSPLRSPKRRVAASGPRSWRRWRSRVRPRAAGSSPSSRNSPRIPSPISNRSS